MLSANTSTKQIVLIVEDEPLLMMHAVGLVEDAGFEAVMAGDADKAIEVLVARTDIRIVLTDIDMPGSMDGLRLAGAIRGRWPPIEIIVMCDKRKLAKDDLPERSHFFTKPYDHDAMVAVLHSLAT
jgi:DNA-binding NtrC family response regulator